MSGESASPPPWRTRSPARCREGWPSSRAGWGRSWSAWKGSSMPRVAARTTGLLLPRLLLLLAPLLIVLPLLLLHRRRWGRRRCRRHQPTHRPTGSLSEALDCSAARGGCCGCSRLCVAVSQAKPGHTRRRESSKGWREASLTAAAAAAAR